MAFAMSGAGLLMLAVFLGPRQGLPVLPRLPEDENVLRIAYAIPLVPDPHQRGFPISTHSQFILSLWEPLIECDPGTGQPQPAAAAAWQWSEDRRTLTIALRRDARWSNGEPVTARDYVRSWQHLLLQEEWAAGLLFPVENAEKYHREKGADPAGLGLVAVDDFTLRIRLAGIRSTFVAELADPLLAPLHVSSGPVIAARRYVREPGALVTNGAFRLVRAGGTGYRLAVNEHYHGRALVRLAGVEYLQAENLPMARLLVAAGRADVMNSAPPFAPDAFPTVRRIGKASEMALVVSTMDLNVTRGPLRDLRVRQALALALDRSGSINPEAAEWLVPAYSWVPDMPGRPGLTVFREDADEARRLLAEAGYPEGRGFPVLLMPVSVRDRSYSHYQAWTESWHRELGIRTYLAPQTEEGRKASMASGEYDIMPNGLIATVPDAGDMLSAFVWPEMFSGSRWSNPAVKQLMDDANNTTGLERLALLERIERLALGEVPTIPMLFQRRLTLLAAEVEGWYADPLGRQALKRLSLRPSAAATTPGGPSL
jgi:oligopeptide transport system substrate-binding protein